MTEPDRVESGRWPVVNKGTIIGWWGHYYYRARFYATQLGRFCSRDSISYRGKDFNLYRFVGNSPVLYVDPDGRIAVRIYADAFIPQAWVSNPWGGELKGDNRNVSQTEGASFRIANWIEIETDEAIRKDPWIASGSQIAPSTTPSHEGDEGETATGRHYSIETATRLGPCEVFVMLTHAGHVPFKFAPFAPGINYGYALVLKREGAKVRYRSFEAIANMHDGFPGYELYIKGTLVYSHDPRQTGEGPTSLWGAGEHHPNIQGVL